MLQDLNTSHGTYVNDCRVQNAAVRLAPGDLIQFGHSSTSYELEVDAGQQHVCINALIHLLNLSHDHVKNDYK